MYDTLKLISRLGKLHKSQKRSYTRETLFDIQKITILQNRQDPKPQCVWTTAPSIQHITDGHPQGFMLNNLIV